MPEAREIITLEACEADDGMRLDAFVAECVDELSRTAAAKLALEGAIAIGGKPSAKNTRVKAGDVITVTLREAAPCEALPQDIPLNVVYEDDCLLVVDKPRGMVVHPAAGNPDGTLVNALLFHCGGSLSGINGVLRPGIVHRIDKDTSGLLVVAKNDAAHRELARQIALHSVTRVYEAIVHGNITESGTIDAPIGRDARERKRFCVTDKNSKSAVTHYEPVESANGFTRVRLRLETGRTHQIRVHMAYIGHPVAGDPVYGPKNTPKLGGQCLHARALGFIHPSTGNYIEFDSPPPEYFEEFARKLGMGAQDG